MSIQKAIVYLGYIILAINVIVYLKNYLRNTKAVTIFTWYLVGSLILQLYSSYLSSQKIYNLFISHYFFIGKFILLSLFFKEVLKNLLLKKIIIICLILVLIVLGVYYYINPSVYYTFNKLEVVLTSLPLITYCFFFFKQNIEEESNSRFIYITTGMFLYFLCSLLIFFVGNVKASIKMIVWNTNAVLYIIYQILIFIDWYKNLRKNDSSMPIQQ
jgi:hypothetical protein